MKKVIIPNRCNNDECGEHLILNILNVSPHWSWTKNAYIYKAELICPNNNHSWFNSHTRIKGEYWESINYGIFEHFVDGGEAFWNEQEKLKYIDIRA